MNVNVTPAQLLAALGVLLMLIITWRAGARRARRTAEAARTGARVVSLAGRVLATAAIILGVQWVVFTHPPNTTLLLVVLALPDLLAGYVLTCTLTVTSLDTTRRGGDRR